MITKKFTCQEHQEYGFLGWVLNTMPHFDPVTGMGVAHDCLEHLTRRVGFEGEMEAFGVALYIRHGGGYWADRGSRDPSWSNNVSTELAEFLARDTNLTVAQAPRTKPLEDEDAEEEIAKMQVRALDDFYAEMAESYGLEDTPREVVALALERAAVWVRRGWLNAERKYGAYQYDVAYMFRQIETEVDKLNPEEGDTLTVRFDRDNTNYSVTHRTPYDRY
jgi:hypothetical protein